MDFPGVLILDGGFSNELAKHCGYDVHKEPMWTARALASDRDAVMTVHKRYLEIGADIIETNTYQATVPGFIKYMNTTTIEAELYIGQAVKLARAALTQYTKSEAGMMRKFQPFIAASIGPYGAYMCDGSEYNGNYENATEAQIKSLHMSRLNGLCGGGANFLAIETIPSKDEVKIILDLVKTHRPYLKCYVCVSLDPKQPHRTAHGERVEDVYNMVKEYPQVWGFGCNCCPPESVTPFLIHVNRERKVEDNIRLVAYPNSGQDWVPGKGWLDNRAPELSSYMNEWVGLGASVIGGCCQVGLSDILDLRLLANTINARSEPCRTYKQLNKPYI